ncbi:alpha/beta fold hydrolase [Roseibium aggregatum]|jgi:pimeloyl-ACP methyl ester carboxylesterase|uniref:alpha/beta fold hydrolase n=1 Tax=Roseibium aggregatum TaxID=187304 RepID=UPI001E3A6560|nr:alpha/beta hydrolase [Roseibium aggregatum]
MACLIQKNLVDADLINNKIDESMQPEREGVLREEDMGGSRVLFSEREGAELLVLTRLASSGSGVWGRLPETLAERHNIVLPRHGRPGGGEGARVLGGFARDIERLVNEMGVERYHLVGWNGGAQIALQATQEHPQRLASLALLSPFRAWGECRQVEKGIEIIELFLRSGRRDLYVWYWFMAGLSDSYVAENFDEVERLVSMRLENDPFVELDVDEAMAWMRELRSDHVSDEALRRVEIPALVMTGCLNRWHAGPTPEMAERIADLIPDAELHLNADCGSMMPVEAPDFVAEQVLRWVSKNQSYKM